MHGVYNVKYLFYCLYW